MPDNEKKKVGFFGKLKNIIFVEDDETEPTILPDYTNETEVVEEKPKVIIHENYEENTLPSRLDKPNVDITPIDVNQVVDIDESIKVDEISEEIKKEEEHASPFLNFDEDEFNILNSRVARNEAKMKEQTKVETKEHLTYNLPPSSAKNTMSSVNNTLAPGKKPFTPSPVISPVYGILDKNYSKEDIVDKRTDRRATLDSLDRVRNKAYGKSEEVKQEKKEPEIDLPNIIDTDIEEARVEEEIVKKEVKKEEKIELPKENKNNKEEKTAKIMDRHVEEDIELPKVENSKKSSIENELINMLNDETDEEELVEEPKKSAKLDDLEKTSTLKILDDIEKELNSIKPEAEEHEDEKSDQILEKDIFNMISSMYVGGDEEDDSD